MLERFTRGAWCTGVWTTRESVLSKSLLWIGGDLEPLSFETAMFWIIPMAYLSLDIKEYYESDYEKVDPFFSMTVFCSSVIDQSRGTELMDGRAATVAEDEVYGAMAAS